MAMESQVSSQNLSGVSYSSLNPNPGIVCSAASPCHVLGPAPSPQHAAELVFLQPPSGFRNQEGGLGNTMFKNHRDIYKRAPGGMGIPSSALYSGVLSKRFFFPFLRGSNLLKKNGRDCNVLTGELSLCSSSTSFLPQCVKRSRTPQKEGDGATGTDCAQLAPATGEQQCPASTARACPGTSSRHCTSCFCSSYPPWHPKPQHRTRTKPVFPKTVQAIVLRRKIYSQVYQLSPTSRIILCQRRLTSVI